MDVIKTAEEIAALKSNWLNDPCYEIEGTEGFEAHRDELLRWRRAIEKKAEAERTAHLRMKAFDLGVSGNVKLAAHIETLERRIAELEERLSR